MNNQNYTNLFDDIPVKYCKSCISLRIANYISDVTKYPLDEEVIHEYDYCANCGSTHLHVCSIEEFLEKYKQRYGHPFLETFK